MYVIYCIKSHAGQFNNIQSLCVPSCPTKGRKPIGNETFLVSEGNFEHMRWKSPARACISQDSARVTKTVSGVLESCRVSNILQLNGVCCHCPFMYVFLKKKEESICAHILVISLLNSGPFVSKAEDTCYFRFKDLKQNQNAKNKLPRRWYRVEWGSTSFRPDVSYTSRLSVHVTHFASLLFGKPSNLSSLFICTLNQK